MNTSEKPEHEAAARGASATRRRAAHLGQRHPGEEADVGGHQRQHAGREEAQQPRGEGDERARARPARSQQPAELPLAALAAHAVDLHPVPLVLEAVLVGDDRQHALEPLVLELDHPAAPLADQMLVVGLRRPSARSA